MSAAAQEEIAEFVCQCGCGEPLARVQRAHDLVRAGATHQQAANIIGCCRENVSILIRKPPRFLVGHYRATDQHRQNMLASMARIKAQRLEQQRITVERIRADRQREAEERLRIREEKLAIAVVARLQLKEEGRQRRLEDLWIRQAAADQKRLMRQRATLRSGLVADLKKRIKAEERGERGQDTTYGVLSLDAPITDAFDGGAGWHEFSGGNQLRLPPVEDPADLVAQDETSARIRQLVGNLDLEDVARMDSASLARLQDRLRSEGLVHFSVSQDERGRLRDPQRHAGGSIQKAHGHYSKKTRQQKIAHKAANRAGGNSNRPSQKPKKRWERTLSDRSG